MVYIHSAHLQNKKLVAGEFCNIHGIGRSNGQRIRAKLQLRPRTRVFQLPVNSLEKITYTINEMAYPQPASASFFGEDGKRIEKKNIYRYIKINSYRGFRHTDNLPCRGQRTHTNGKTRKKGSQGQKRRS